MVHKMYLIYAAAVRRTIICDYATMRILAILSARQARDRERGTMTIAITIEIEGDIDRSR